MKFFFYILKYSGIPLFIKEFIQKNKVTILLYHNISVQSATLHFQHLKEKYNIIPLQTYIKAHKENKVNDLPKRSLVITLDDGHKDNYKLLPLLKEMHIPITIFLCSHIIGTNRNYWFNHPVKNLPIEKLKRMNNQERLNFLKNYGFEEELEYDERSALSYSEIIEMSDYVDFQSHSTFHSYLPYCTDKESESEIGDSKNKLEQLFNFKINSFSYPQGMYGDREIEFLKKYGYEAGISCDLWFNDQKTNIYRLKRITCRDEASITELDVKISGIYAFIKRLFGIEKR